MNTYDFYITPEEYEIARKNGIRAKTLDNRIRNLLWDKERAINTKPKRFKETPDYIKKLAEKNGINMRTYKSRVNRLGWDMYRAATEPIHDTTKNIINAHSVVTKYPIEYKELAKANGIPIKCFYNRVTKYKWSIEKAATTPVMTPSEIGLMTKEKRSKTLDYIFIKNKAIKNI